MMLTRESLKNRGYTVFDEGKFQRHHKEGNLPTINP